MLGHAAPVPPPVVASAAGVASVDACSAAAGSLRVAAFLRTAFLRGAAFFLATFLRAFFFVAARPSEPSEAVGSLVSSSPTAASNASEERRDEAAWGSGLAKGFLSAAPKRRRRKAAPAAEAAKAAEAAAAAAKAAKVEAEKARGERCAACARRLPLTATLAAKCRCGGCYCNEHRAPECHACNFDFRGAARRRLEADHPKLSAPKIERLSSAVE